MNTPTPTPRTDAAWAKTFLDDDDQCRAGNAASQMRDECATLERELAALTAERDQLRAALALGQQNCDDAYDELRGDCDELRGDVVRLTAERDQLNEMFHQIRLKLTEASGDPYKLHDEALDDIISERDQLRAAIAEMPTCRCDRSTEQQCELSAKVATLTAERDQLRARAERAEAELAEMHNEVAGGSAAGQRLEEWLCGITEALRELPQVNNATSVHLWNLRAAYFNAKPPLTRDDTLLNAARAELIALRAELTVALAHWNGALERAMKAEAELATERARLRHVALDAAMKGGEK